MSKVRSTIFTLFLFFFFFTKLCAQSYTTVLNGTVISLPCNVACTTLQFKVPQLRATNDYTLGNIPYSPFAFTSPSGTEPFASYATAVVDDRYSPLQSMPFSFCFFDSSYSKLTVGDNGVITFDASQAGKDNAFPLVTGSTPRPIPYAGGTPGQFNSLYYPPASIMSPYHDLEASSINSPPDRKIEVRVEGVAPFRRYIISYNKVPLYFCNTLLATQQVVLYESTGVIDIFLENKPVCTNWPTPFGGGLAILGIQNWKRDKAVAAPGKNATQWSATNEGYHFNPVGATRFVKSELFTLSGTLLQTTGANDTTTTTTGSIDVRFPGNICPTGNTRYVVKTTYTACGLNAQPLIFWDTVTVNSPNINAVATTTAAVCGPTGSITVSIPAGVAPPFTLSLNGAAPVTTSNQTYTFSSLNGGPYSIDITSSGGCTQTLTATVPANNVFNVNATTVATSCDGAADGRITILPQNGTAPYTYTLDAGAPQSSNIFSNLKAGVYNVTVKDNSGCQTIINITVTPGPVLIISASATPPTCNGGANGTITVTVNTGTPPFQYQVNSGPAQSSNIFNNLTAGNYIITVTDSKGCFLQNYPVLVPAGSGNSITATAIATNASCSGVANGSINITPLSGSAPYQYSLNGGAFQNGTTIPNLPGGTYSVVVRDAAGCTSQPIAVTVPQGTAITATAATTAAACSGVSNGSITITPTNGTAPYTYALNGGAAQTNNTFQNLASGNYTITVKDASGCTSAPLPVTVSSGTTFTITATAQATSCNGAANGMVTITASGGVAPYTYSINGGAFGSSNVFSNLNAGGYNIIVKDNLGCSSSAINTTVLSGTSITGTAIGTGTTCNGAANGSITVSPTNGSSPYTFSMDAGPFQSSNIFTGVSAGLHNVVIRDAAGCLSASIPVTINSGSTLTATATATQASCTGVFNGSIIVNPTNGIAPYSYSLNGGAYQASNIFNALAAGNYSVVLKDGTGCISAPIAVTVTTGSGITASVVVNPTLCNGATNGKVTVTPAGGISPYQFSINGAAFQAGNTFSNLAAGVYSISVKDAVGCMVSSSATITSGQPLTATVITGAVLCTGGADGTAAINISSNGTPPFQYSLDGVTYQASNVFTNLPASAYTVYFKEANGCSGTQTFNITQPAVLTVTTTTQNVVCNGAGNGSIIVSVSGGTTPYLYSLNGNAYQASNQFSVAAGTHTLTVKDANGCTSLQTVTVIQPASLKVTVTSMAATCAGNDGTITVTASGGTAPYQYAINGGIYQSSNIILVAPGTHNVQVKDANNCSFSITGVVVDLTNNLSLTPLSDVTICEGTGIVLQPVTNADQFTWSPATGLSSITVPAPTASPANTTQYVVAANLGICSAKDSVIVFVLPAPVANAGTDATICFGQDYQLQGSGGVQYQWAPATYLNNSSIADPTSVLPAQTIQYNLHVVDANNCRSLQPDVVKLTVTPPIKVYLSKDTVVSLNDVVQLSASAAATSFSWSPATGLNNPFIANPVAAISGDIRYTVTVKDVQGCTGQGSLLIRVFNGPEIYVPTLFTPNNDGRNEIFRPFPVGIKKLNYFRVYNRWGQLIYSTTTLMAGWDGRFGAADQPTGTYVWVAEAVTKEDKLIRKRGTVTLVR